MAREVKLSGRTVYLPDREEWEEVQADEPNTWLEGPLKCSGCGFCVGLAEAVVGPIHWRPAEGGWQKCGEWR